MSANAGDKALAFAAEMLAAGYPAVVIYVDEANAIRMATPQLPTEIMARMLDTARDSYTARMRKALN